MAAIDKDNKLIKNVALIHTGFKIEEDKDFNALVDFQSGPIIFNFKEILPRLLYLIFQLSIRRIRQ